MRALSFVGTAMLSITPLDLNRKAILLMVDRLTPSSRASSFQAGRTNLVSASIRRSSAFRNRSSISNGILGGRPLGLPVALCFFFMVSKGSMILDTMGLPNKNQQNTLNHLSENTFLPLASTRQRIFQLQPSSAIISYARYDTYCNMCRQNRSNLFYQLFST